MNSSIKKLLLAIDQALDEQGLSDRGASMTAVGQPDLIKNMRRGQMPSYDRVLALLRTLDIDPVTLKLKHQEGAEEAALQALPEEVREVVEAVMNASSAQRGFMKLAIALPEDKQDSLRKIMSALVDAESLKNDKIKRPGCAS